MMSGRGISASGYNPNTTFNGIGGKNNNLYYQGDLGYWQGLGQFPQGHQSEPVVRFRLVEPYDAHSDSYMLQSNNFYTGRDLHIFTIEVQRRTGRLKIAQWHRLRPDFMVTEAIISPFGIVSGLVPNMCWLWLWKAKWSERVEPSPADGRNS
jgi:hypothetical protein